MALDSLAELCSAERRRCRAELGARSFGLRMYFELLHDTPPSLLHYMPIP